MKKAPEVIFLVDLNKEDIAIREAARLNVPVVALTDTNVDPGVVAFPIPSNDDSARALRLFLSAVADVVIEARKVYQSRPARGEGRGEDAPAGRGGRSHRGGAQHYAPKEQPGAVEQAAAPQADA